MATHKYFEKVGKNWVCKFEHSDELSIYKLFAQYVTGKYVCGWRDITRMERRTDYSTGNHIYTFYITYDDGSKGKHVFNVNA